VGVQALITSITLPFLDTTLRKIAVLGIFRMHLSQLVVGRPAVRSRIVRFRGMEGEVLRIALTRLKIEEKRRNVMVILPEPPRPSLPKEQAVLLMGDGMSRTRNS